MQSKIKLLLYMSAFLLVLGNFAVKQGAGDCTPNVDVAFLIDSSGSIKRSDYTKMKTFVSNLAEKFQISPSGSRAAVVLYSTDATVSFTFGTYTSPETFRKAVMDLRHERGFTRIDRALIKAYYFVFRGNTRFLAQKLIFVLTDGEQTKTGRYTPLDRASYRLKQEGVRIIAIGIGKKVNMGELKQIASKEKDIIVAKTFDDLTQFLNPLLKTACDDVTEVPACETPVDIAFLADSSGSISRINYIKEKTFINAVAKSFVIDKARSRAALVLFSDSASVKIRFSDHTTTRSFQEAVGRLKLERGRTRIDKALEVARREVFPYARPGVHQIAMVITDGVQTQEADTKDLREASAPLRDAGVKILAIGIGSSTDPAELRLMVEKDEDVLLAKSFDHLILKLNSLIKKTCNLAEPVPCHIPVDLAFIFSSGGIEDTNFIRQKLALKTIAKAFALSPRESQASILTYGGYAASVTPSQGIDSFSSTEDFLTAINSLRYGRNRGDIKEALKLALEKVFPRARKGVAKVAVIIIDGEENKNRGWRNSVLLLRKMGVRVVLVGVGSDALRSSLLPLVENKADLVLTSSFNDMMRNAVDLAKTTCNAAVFPPCKLHADVAFLIDTSQNALKGYLTQQKNFAKILMKSFSGNWSFSIVTYGRNAIVKASLSQSHNLSHLEQTVDEIAHDKVDEGQVRLDKAMDLAISDVFPRARPGVTKIDLIFTDGRPVNSSNALEVIRSSEASRKADVRLLTLGIGKGVDPNEWSRVVEYDNDLIYLRDSQELTFKVRDIAATVCAAAGRIYLFSASPARPRATNLSNDDGNRYATIHSRDCFYEEI